MSTKTAIVLVDPLNDFLHPQGKLHAAVQQSLGAKRSIYHMQLMLEHARNTKLPVFYALHQGVPEAVTADWQHMNASLTRLRGVRAFEEGSFGAAIFDGMEPQESNGDVVVSKHWNSR